MIIKGLRQAKDYLDKLPPQPRAEIDAVLEDLQNHGLDAPLVSMRPIEGKLWEMREVP